MFKLKKIAIIPSIGFILLSFLFLSCNQRVTDKVVLLIRKKCTVEENCTLKVAEVTSFTWDEFYFFDHAVLDQEVNKVLGKQVFSTSISSGYAHKLVFMKNGDVVYKEEQPTNLEVTLDGEVYFNIDQSTKFGKFSKDSLFEVKKIKSSKGEHYDLTCLNCN